MKMAIQALRRIWRSICGLVLLGALALSAQAASDPKLGLATNATANRAFGSSDAAAMLVTSDYNKAVDTAWPPVTQSQLEQAIAGLLSSPPGQRDPLTLKSGNDVAKLLGISADASDVRRDQLVVNEARRYYYGIDKRTERVAYARSATGLKPVDASDARNTKEIRDRHEQLLTSVGIDRSQLFLDRSVLVFAGSDSVLPRAAAGKRHPEAMLTYALRALNGMHVDGSYAKLVSDGARELMILDIVWPGVELHPGIKDSNCRAIAALRREIVSKTARIAGGSKVTVLMSVVLRPVRVNSALVFIPAMKVGVMPYADGNDEAVTFYADLPRAALSYDVAAARDDDDDDADEE
jgi:hypothetical protein